MHQMDLTLPMPTRAPVSGRADNGPKPDDLSGRWHPCASPESVSSLIQWLQSSLQDAGGGMAVRRYESADASAWVLVCDGPQCGHPLARPARGDGIAVLSRREAQVVALVAKGLSNKQVAVALALSPNTVKRHMARILRRCRLPSRSAVAAWYAAAGAGLTQGMP